MDRVCWNSASWGETWFKDDLTSSLVLHVEFNGFLNLMEAVSRIHLSFQFVPIHSFCFEHDFKVLCQSFFREVVVQQEGLDSLSFTDESYSVYISSRFVGKKAVEEHGRLETHKL